MNKRFGSDAWCKGWQRETRPVGDKCLHCKCNIMKDDDGYIVAYAPGDGSSEWRPMHRICMNEVLGRVDEGPRRESLPRDAPRRSAYRGMGKRPSARRATQ